MEHSGNRGEKLFTGGMYVFAAVAPFSNAGMEMVTGYLTVVWIVRMIAGRRVMFRMNYLNVFLFLYLALMVVSGALSVHPLRSALMVREEWIVLLYFAVLNNMPSRRVFLQTLRILAVSCAVVGVYAVWQHFSGYDIKSGYTVLEHSGYFRSAGFFGLCLTFGGFFIIAYITILGSFFGSASLRDRLLFGSSAVILFFAIIASYTRSSWIGAAFGSVILAFVYRWKTGFVYVFVFLLAWTGIYFLHPSLFSSYGVASIADPGYSEGSRGRMTVWGRGWEMWQDNPVLGIGVGNIKDYKEQYNWPEIILGYGHMHNEILNIAVQMGILGVLAFAGMWWAFFAGCCRFWKRARLKDPQTAAAVLGSAGAIAGILAAGFFQCHYTDIEVGMIWWFIVGMASAAPLLPPNQNAQNFSQEKGD